MPLLIEKTLIGNILRVSCIDENTGAEAVFQAPRYATDKEIERLAQLKIKYILEKSRENK
ncbi:MAG: hypothetical protein FWF23_02250 [Alphaproteobacteria bacterium]|nr:hypothetical protein [Alphaproteobacteria bacterium]MCL2504817.1 hypothetical protein [Alphaproteobacteria bacterium]